MPSSSQKQGSVWEEVSARHLESRGFTILERNLRMARAEVDIVAQKEGMLVFVEVKGRSSGPDGLPGHLSVTRTKRSRIARAAGEYLARLPQAPREIRFDVISIDAGRVRHYPGAFRPSGWTY